MFSSRGLRHRRARVPGVWGRTQGQRPKARRGGHQLELGAFTLAVAAVALLAPPAVSSASPRTAPRTHAPSIAVGERLAAAPLALQSAVRRVSRGQKATAGAMAARMGLAWPQQAALGPGASATGEDFGYSVSLLGTTALVGAPTTKVGSNVDQGAAYIFVASGGTWSEQAELVVPGGRTGQYFGTSVSLSTTGAMVGAPGAQGGGSGPAGAVYIFDQAVGVVGGRLAPAIVTGRTWKLEASVPAPRGASGAGYGASVDLAGNAAVVGAPEMDTGTGATGAAFVLAVSSGSLDEQDELTATNGAAGDEFGYSVAISASTAIVGAFDARGELGSAYIFQGKGTTWTEEQELGAPNAELGDAFGYSVALDGSTALVGAPLLQIGTGLRSGAAFAFAASSGVWSYQQELAAPDPNGDGFYEFGQSVALSGATAVVGAMIYQGMGTAYLFGRTGPNWALQQQLTAAGVRPGDNFGWAVSISRDLVVVASYKHNPSGGVYVFGQLAQAVAFTSTPPTPAAVGGTYTPTATGGASGNPVVLSIDAASDVGACALDSSGTIVTFTGPGQCIIDADQAGSVVYADAPEAQQEVIIGGATTVSTTTTVGPTTTTTAPPAHKAKPQAPKVTSAVKRVIVSRGKAAVRVSCGVARCSGVVELLNTNPPRLRGKARKGTVVLAKAQYSLRAEKAEIVDMGLTAEGETVLADVKRHATNEELFVSVRGGASFTKLVSVS